MFSIFSYIMSRVTHSEPGLPMFEPGTEVVFGFSGVVFSSNSSKWSNSRATLAVSNLSESWSTSEAEEVEEIFAIGTPLSCTRFFFSTSLDRLLSSFLGSQSSFGCIFMVFFYIFLLSKGDSWNQSTWN